MTASEDLERVFAILEAAAVKGERCTTRDELGRLRNVPVDLAHLGRIRIEIYAMNFRRIKILTGPNAGCATAAHPNKKLKPWKIIGTETILTRRAVPADLGRSKRQQPSAPRLLSSKDL